MFFLCGMGYDILSKRIMLILFAVPLNQLTFAFPDYFTGFWIYGITVFLWLAVEKARETSANYLGFVFPLQF